MATILSFLSGRQITDDNGEPQAGALLYHYNAGTTNNQTVYSNQAGTTPHAQPVVCDAGGFVPLIYIGDTNDWKVVIQDADEVELQTYDNLPKAVAEVSAADFAPPLLEWTQVTSAASPVALTAADAGKAYEADTTSGSIEFDLPSAASVGDGKGFVFKKTSASNTLTIDPNSSETIDDVSTSLTITVKDEALGIFSNGAEWYKVFDVTKPIPTVQRFTSGTAQTYTPATNTRFIRVRMVGGGGGGAANDTNAGAVGTTTSFGSWTAIFGNGGLVGTEAAGGVGGTGGADGTGTLIARFSGQNGARCGGVAGTVGGDGGSTPFGGAGSGGDNSVAGVAAKTNTGSGGGAAEESSGGGAGEYVEFFVTAPAPTTYTVGAGGAGGAAGTVAGGNGAAGIIIVEEYY